MKKFVLLALLTLISFLIQAQEFPLPRELSVTEQVIDTTSEWRVDFSIWFEPFVETIDIYRDFIEGDTIINSYVYYRVFKSGYWQENFSQMHYYNHVFHHFLREENNKWYTIDDYQQEDLLYDFNLEVGDTVNSAFTHYNDYPITITAIDTILVDSEPKKRFHLNWVSGADYIIEDIGATSGLFENMVFVAWESNLVCFAKDGVSVWGESTEDCDLAVTVPEKFINDQLYSAYPNPASEYIIVVSPYEFNSEATVSLIDSYGRVVLQRLKIYNHITRISLNSLQPGLYIILIESTDKKQYIKLLIT
jgi:hypothetical protein